MGFWSQLGEFAGAFVNELSLQRKHPSLKQAASPFLEKGYETVESTQVSMVLAKDRVLLEAKTVTLTVDEVGDVLVERDGYDPYFVAGVPGVPGATEFLEQIEAERQQGSHTTAPDDDGAPSTTDQTLTKAQARETLGVESNATKAEIKSAYRRLIVQYHPDKYADRPREFQEVAQKRTLEIKAAYVSLPSEN